jgi:hypothetical protein
MTPEAEVTLFNRQFPEGSKVLLKRDGVDQLLLTRTNSKAFLMCGQAVVFLRGVSGCYRTTHIFPTAQAEGDAP